MRDRKRSGAPEQVAQRVVAGDPAPGPGDRTRTGHRALLATLAAGLLAAVSGCAEQVSTYDDPAAASGAPGCVVRDDLTEKVLDRAENGLGGPYPSTGNSATYISELYDADGNRIARIFGKSSVPPRFPNGNVAEHAEEVIEFTDGGVVETEGLYDLTALDRGEHQFLTAIGTGGAFKDKLGRRVFRQQDGQDGQHVRIEMCSAGMLK